MIRRCIDPKNVGYPGYGARGITVCARWRESFEAFLEDMGPCPPEMSIDREKNDQGYNPDNCRWATVEVQQSNRRDNVQIQFEGRTQTLSQWSVETGLPKTTLWNRLNRAKWPIARALKEPLCPGKRRPF